jgi:hypothetical protein
MPDPKISHEDLEKYIQQLPSEIIAKLPNNTASRRAKDHIDLAYGYAKEAREQQADR